MKNVPSLLVTAVLASALAPMASAQTNPTGSYTLYKKDGTPVEPGHTWSVVVVPLYGFPGLYAFFVSRDGDPVPDEGGFLSATGPSSFVWENRRGTTGTLVSVGGGDYLSTVTSGPNAGLQRMWK